MTDIFLGIIAAELGFMVMCVVGIFTLDTFAIFQRNRADKCVNGTLRVLTPEEMIANGLDPKNFMNPTSSAPGAVGAQVGSGQYL